MPNAKADSGRICQIFLRFFLISWQRTLNSAAYNIWQMKSIKRNLLRTFKGANFYELKLLVLLVSCSFVLLDARAVLTFVAESKTAQPANPVSVQITVLDFTDVYSASCSVTWDPLVLDYSSASVNPALGAFAGLNTTLESGGYLGYFWTAANLQGDNESYPDNTVLFTVNFDVIGSAGSDSDILFAGQPPGPTALEVWDNAFSPVDFTTSPGNISVVPEPVTSALCVFGCLVLGAGIIHRKRMNASLPKD